MADGVTFSPASARRVAKAVRQFERLAPKKNQRTHKKGPDKRGTGGGTPVDVKIVLIDADIEGIDEADPEEFITASDITVTEGWTVEFQDPPDDDLTANWMADDQLNLWRYKRRQLSLKYFRSAGSETGTAGTVGTASITLEDGVASVVDDYYVGDLITADGQTREIIDYDGTTRVATVDADWSPALSAPEDYSITRASDLKLATTIVDDEANSRHIVRYAKMSVLYDDGRSWVCGEYKRSDYPDYDENTTFPPEGIPEGFLTRKYRGIVIGGVLVTILCKPLPPPDLTSYL